MATLIVADRKNLPEMIGQQPIATLREWLRGQWAVLFSNPEHFAPHPSTPDGFITLLAEDFAEYGVRPIVLGGTDAQCWLEYAGADAATVVIDRSTDDARVVDLADRVLARKLEELPDPFVIVLDANGHCRSTITYKPLQGNRPRTIYDILAIVQVLQRGSPAHGMHGQTAGGQAAIGQTAIA